MTSNLRYMFEGVTEQGQASPRRDDSIHLVIVSHKFDRIRMKEKDDLIWSVLVDKLELDEWGKVSLSIGTSAQEIQEMI